MPFQTDKKFYQEDLDHAKNDDERQLYQERLEHIEHEEQAISEIHERTLILMNDAINYREELMNEIETITENEMRDDAIRTLRAQSLINLRHGIKDDVNEIKQMISEDEEMGTSWLVPEIQAQFFNRYDALLKRVMATSNVVQLSERRKCNVA